MRNNLIVAAMCCLPMGLMAQKGFTIKGKVGTQDAPVMAYLKYRNEDVKVVDSVVLHKGQFVFKGKVSHPVQASISIGEDDLMFYLENSAITITSRDSMWRADVKGSRTNDDEKLLMELQRPYRKSADSVKTVYFARTAKEREDSVWKKAISAVMASTNEGYERVSKDFIAGHLQSYAALVAFGQFELGYNFNADTAAVKFARFSAGMRETSLGKKYMTIIDTGRKTSIGVTAMDFTQRDTTGKEVKLSDFRGQYVLVDFWASWCKPCRAENPNLVAAYKKFKDKQFTILGVSLDDEKTRKAWIYAVEKDGLPWTQVSELKGFESAAAKLYGVQAIPSNFLVDPNGKIVGRNLRGEELEKKLGEIFAM